MDKKMEYRIRTFIKDISKYISPNIILIELTNQHFPELYKISKQKENHDKT